MLDLSTRTAVLRLAQAGHGAKRIAKDLRVSRNSVRLVLASGEVAVPTVDREQKLDAHEARIRELFIGCKGNLVRVHEDLVAEGVAVSYQTVTRFCREIELGVRPKKRVGQYDHPLGKEMQHDTSPHRVKLGGTEVSLHCASLVLAFSRMRYVQVYLEWNRLQCRQFLTDGIVALGGAASICVVDNSSVVLKRGSGKDAIAAAEMEALGKRFGFKFLAHEINDPNRKASVERGFSFVEDNFYAGRTFISIDDCNAQLLAWWEKKSLKTNTEMKATPAALYQEERPHLQPLPLHIPEVYITHERKVNVESLVSLHSNRYPVPERWLGKTVEIREEVARIVIHRGHENIIEYRKERDGAQIRLPWPVAWRSRTKPGCLMSPEEETLRRRAPFLEPMIALLRKRYGGQGRRGMKRLLRIWEDYPTNAVEAAVVEAVRFGMTDLSRIEGMVLRRVATEYFKLPEEDDGDA